MGVWEYGRVGVNALSPIPSYAHTPIPPYPHTPIRPFFSASSAVNSPLR